MSDDKPPRCGNCGDTANYCTCWDDDGVMYSIIAWRLKHNLIKSKILKPKE